MVWRFQRYCHRWTECAAEGDVVDVEDVWVKGPFGFAGIFALHP